ncbi:hypothetical protein SO802_013702 [Lithocarpus litseifolius]|uniref:Uncharacterized protein n=1 Tax=Lithocarpus litseifolius TaxID=425828 RepID=A0AAW2DBU5_9ROSI
MDTRANEQFLGPRRDLNDLLSDEAFANLPFLILCTTQSFDYPEEELCSLLNLTNVTIGKGLLELGIANAHPLEVFVAEKYNTKEYLRGFRNSRKKIFTLCRICTKRLVQHQPTQYPASEEMGIGKIMFNAFDLGGHQIAHRVWKDYYAKKPKCYDSSAFIIPDKHFQFYLESTFSV